MQIKNVFISDQIYSSLDTTTESVTTLYLPCESYVNSSIFLVLYSAE